MANLPYVTGNESKVLGIMKMYSRMGAYPLDATSVFNTKAELEAYINETGSYAYAGQVVAVANGEIGSANGAKNYTLYIIRSDKTVQEIGKNLIFDSVDAATAYATANPAAFRAGEVFTVKNDTRYDLYTFNAAGAAQKLSFDASTDLPDMEWSSILNKPTSAVADIDNAVAFVKNGLAENEDGSHLNYEGKALAFSEDLTWSNVAEKPETFTPSAHTHEAADILSVNASAITGVISLDNLPAGALERCVVVANDEARFALTTENIQLGDTVKVEASGKMYFVKDASQLSSEAGYEVYTAGSATEVPWSGVTGKPTDVKSFAADAVSTADVTETAEAGKLLKANADGKLDASITGDADTVDGKHASDFAEAVHGHAVTDVEGLQSTINELKAGSSITSLEATKLNGTVPVANLPTEALMKVVHVASEDAAKALTSDDVNNGDIVVVEGGNMFVVKDNSALADGAGLEVVTGEATSVEWTNVQNKPTEIKQYASDAVSTADVASTATAGKLLPLNSEAKLPASITGDADTVDGKHAADFAEAVHKHTEDDINGNISWTKLSGVPTTIAGYGITDAVNSSEVVEVAEAGKLLKLDSSAKLPASITGDADTVDGKHAADFAEAVHGHEISEVNGLSDELTNIKNGTAITALDSAVLTGTISIDRLPHGALERCVVVANDEARFALTTADVQLGDTVKVVSSGKMYFVKDEAQLASEDGYDVYTAGSATEVPWSGVTGKPTTIAGYGITDAYTMTQADSTFVAQTEVVAVAEANKILKLDAEGKLPASITGEAGSVAWANVQNKPNSSVEAIDTAVAAATHTNRETLDKLTADADNAGHVKYDGNTVANMSDVTNQIVVSETQPENQPVGALWFEVVSEA